VIDLCEMSRDLPARLGDAESKKLFMHIPPGEAPVVKYGFAAGGGRPPPATSIPDKQFFDNFCYIDPDSAGLGRSRDPMKGEAMNFSDKKREFKVFNGQKESKLGTEGNPAVVIVKTKEKEKEVAAIFAKNGWTGAIEVNPDKPEDLTDLQRLEQPLKPTTVKATPGRNDPCPCGSGKKYKKCHGA
jgi:SWIM/SEC-C metal-binding protein